MILVNWSDLTETCNCGEDEQMKSRFLGNPEPLSSVFSVDSVVLGARTWHGSMALRPWEKASPAKGQPFPS